jgi:uncharacterized protein YneF (UPF0154 family)
VIWLSAAIVGWTMVCFVAGMAMGAWIVRQ